MNFLSYFRLIGSTIAALVLAAGCATQQKKPEAPAPVPEPEPAIEQQAPSGPSAADAEQAILAAKAALKKAASVDGVWRDSGAVLAKAEAAAKAGDYAKAIELAQQARQQGEMGYNQAMLERAKHIMGKLEAYKGSMTADQRDRLAAAHNAYRNYQGDRAYSLASELWAEIAASNISYVVERGDSLWRISGKDEIYGNPYQWPLIYKQNKSQIRDADLIYPGQNFQIQRTPSGAEVDAAIRHARTRGAWSIGVVEEADLLYLRH